MEIWKDVPGYVGLYQVSNLGNIRSLSKKRGWLQLLSFLTPKTNHV